MTDCNKLSISPQGHHRLGITLDSASCLLFFGLYSDHNIHFPSIKKFIGIYSQTNHRSTTDLFAEAADAWRKRKCYYSDNENTGWSILCYSIYFVLNLDVLKCIITFFFWSNVLYFLKQSCPLSKVKG